MLLLWACHAILTQSVKIAWQKIVWLTRPRDLFKESPLKRLKLVVIFLFCKVPHEALGVGDPTIVPDSAFDSSSERISLDYIANKSLSGVQGVWCSYYTDAQQWLQAYISYARNHGKLAVEATKPISEDSWVLTYKLNKSTDGKDWTVLENYDGQVS